MHSFTLSTAFATFLLPFIYAQESTTTISIFDASKTHTYLGCYGDSNQTEGLEKARESEGGVTKLADGEMTVPKCIDMCSQEKEQYRYVGLQAARECWCSQTLAGVVSRVDDSACDMACEGDDLMACGGLSQTSLYRLQTDDWSPSRISGYIAITGLALAVL